MYDRYTADDFVFQFICNNSFYEKQLVHALPPRLVFVSYRDFSPVKKIFGKILVQSEFGQKRALTKKYSYLAYYLASY